MANRISQTEWKLLTETTDGRIHVQRDVTRGQRGGTYTDGQREWNAALKLTALGFATIVSKGESRLPNGHRERMVLELTQAGREKRLTKAPDIRLEIEDGNPTEQGRQTPLSILYRAYRNDEAFVRDLMSIPGLKEALK